MLLLAIDTSTPTVTAGVVALSLPSEIIAAPAAEPVRVLAEHRITDQFAHAEQLMPLVCLSLDEAGQSLSQLAAIVVGLGPGPFTGLRVGIATAQALGDALDVAVHGVSSHDATARSYLAESALGPAPAAGDFLVVTDARRREIYLSAYSGNGLLRFGPAPVAPADVPAQLAEHGVRPGGMLGAGTPLLADVPGLHSVPTLPFAAGRSAGLVLAAARALLTGVVPGPLIPLYLRRPDATEPGARKSVLGR